jgi:hypothetical protein
MVSMTDHRGLDSRLIASVNLVNVTPPTFVNRFRPKLTQKEDHDVYMCMKSGFSGSAIFTRVMALDTFCTDVLYNSTCMRVNTI